MVADLLRLDGFMRTLDNWGLTDVLLPFLLIFVIIYAILQKTKILGEGRKNLNAVIALVVALLVVVPHATGRYSGYADPVQIINDSLPQVSVVLVAVIFLLILIGVFGQEQVFLGVSMPGWVAFFSFATIVAIFGGSAGWWNGTFNYYLENLLGDEYIAIIVMILVFGLIIAWITSDSKEREDRTLVNRVGVDFGKLFGGGKGGH